MVDRDLDILKNINDCGRLTAMEICHDYNISSNELLEVLIRLKSLGYYINRIYRNDGNILLSNKTNINGIHLETIKGCKKVRFVAISDTHHGYEQKSSFSYIKRVKKHCLNNDIHWIFHLGDVAEGVVNSFHTKNKSISSQLRAVLNTYPYDDKIQYFMIFGNHDIWTTKIDGFNPVYFMENKRMDLIPVGIKKGTIKINDEAITLLHDAGSKDEPAAKIILKGHSHQYKMQNDTNGCIIYTPTLSQIEPSDERKNKIPGFLDIEVSLYNRGFNTIKIDQYLLIEEPVKIDSMKCDLLKKIKK